MQQMGCSSLEVAEWVHTLSEDPAISATSARENPSGFSSFSLSIVFYFRGTFNIHIQKCDPRKTSKVYHMCSICYSETRFSHKGQL